MHTGAYTQIPRHMQDKCTHTDTCLYMYIHTNPILTVFNKRTQVPVTGTGVFILTDVLILMDWWVFLPQT